MKNEVTSKRVAAIAAKVLSGDITVDTIKSSELKALAASALTQAADKPKTKK